MANKAKKATKRNKKTVKNTTGLFAQAKVANTVALEVGEDIVDLSLKGAAASQKVLSKVIKGGITIFGMQQKYALDILEKVVTNKQLQKMVKMPLNYMTNVKNDAEVIVDNIKEETMNVAKKIKAELPTVEKTTKKVTTKAGAKKVTTVKVTATKAKAKKAVVKKDDLTKIKGIGPKVAQIFTKAGYGTYSKLANASATKLEKVLAKAGTRYSSMNAAPWIEQAVFAADNDWAGLKTWNARG